MIFKVRLANCTGGSSIMLHRIYQHVDSLCLEIRYVTVSYYDTTTPSLFIYCCATSSFYQHGIHDTSYDTPIVTSLTKSSTDNSWIARPSIGLSPWSPGRCETNQQQRRPQPRQYVRRRLPNSGYERWLHGLHGHSTSR